MSEVDPTLAALGAGEAVALIRNGQLKSEELVRSCLARVDEVDDKVQAWTYLDPDYAIEQARRVDRAHQAGVRLGPLHGIPVGLKDIFDTADMPTENGTVIHSGRKPEEDATAVALLRQAGAVIMGKTVTTELAFFTPGKTQNPHNPAHTPGGSSSGSAAAVAAGMVPFAVGTQTNGSVIRPAAFCGVVGYKPTHGLISRYGVLPQSRALDTVGVFARSVPDAAMLAEAMMSYDSHDLDMRPSGRPRLPEVAAEDPPLAPVLAFIPGPVWDQAEEETRDAFAELAEALGESCDKFDLPEIFGRGQGALRTINAVEMACSYVEFYERGKDKLSQVLIDMIEEGRRYPAVEYKQSLDWASILNEGLDEVFERFDAIVTPAAAGPAPEGLEATGSPAFCTLWSLCGTPAVSLPLLRASNGLPMGVQLVGRRGDDARLLRTARWLHETLAGQATDQS
jgi:Asp-tRNA(Asn)/Glu-tRNA(Gln) amidotransferase A subunit family amidase